MNAIVTLEAKIRRGPESWAYIYIALGFALTIEGTTIDMALSFPWNLLSYLVVGALTVWLFLFNGWFQNKLIGIKAKYEAAAR